MNFFRTYGWVRIEQRMPISNENFGAVIFLSELHIQCTLFTRYADRLEEAAQHWINIGNHVDDGRKAAPIDIVASCTVCLASMAAIRRMIIPLPGNDKTARRRQTLQELLDYPSLPVIASATVRNSWEHLDERLDDLLPNLNGSGISQIHVSTNPLKDTIALKRFDPEHCTIHFANESIPLRQARDEIEILSARVDAAMIKLQSSTVRLWQD